MTKVLKLLLPGLAVTVCALATGFHVFTTSIGSYSACLPSRADGIVVLTGGEDRVATGINLMTGGHAKRLLISGVNPRTHSPAELQRRVGGNRAVFDCCVDLGHGALDTIGNAEEARRWAEANGFRSLIVVTSSYHMPRSMMEFRHALPEHDLQPCPVSPRSLKLDTWWQHHPTARLLVGEYLKFLTSAARLGVSRTFAGAKDRATPAMERPAESAGHTR